MHQERRNNSRRLACCQEAIRTIDISEENIGQHWYISSISNSTSLPAIRMLAYFKREYYSRAWQNIGKPLLRRPYVSQRRQRFHVKR